MSDRVAEPNQAGEEIAESPAKATAPPNPQLKPAGPVEGFVKFGGTVVARSPDT